MKNKIKIFFSFAFLFAILLFSGCGKQNTGYSVSLEVWGLFDDSSVYEEIINEYKKINPYVGEIKYRKFTQEGYRRELIEAMASGQGPDIFMIQNNWVPSFASRIEPAPDVVLSETDVRNNFVDTVFNDFVNQKKVYGLPLSVDSLALYYNRDMFNAVGITSPPKTWDEFNEAVKRLTKLDLKGEIVQAGAAIGTAYNINRSTDVLGLLMFQNGVQMISEQGNKASLNIGVINSDGNVVKAGENALGYYAQFSNVNSPFYTWNSKLHYSVDAFSENGVAMMLNYSWHRPTIISKNSKLNFGIAPVPQIDSLNPVNYANYWGYSVAKNKNSKMTVNGQVVDVPNEIRTHEAWQFLKFLTVKNNGTFKLINGRTGNSKDFMTNIDPAIVYLKATEKPAARRDIIELQKNDPVIGAYAYGNLIAKSWYQVDPDGIEKILAEMIDSLNRNNASLYDALTIATNRINEIMKQ